MDDLFSELIFRKYVSEISKNIYEKKIQKSVGKNSVILTRSKSNMAFKKAGIKIVVLKVIL